MKQIDPSDLVPMDKFTKDHPIRIDIVYADGDHPENIFDTSLYNKNARLWLHKDMCDIVLKAAKACHKDHGYYFVLKDGLRTVEAQAAMQKTDIVKANPHWCKGPGQLLSNPGQGAHPRGMAIDLVLETKDGKQVDMGTSFDHLSTDPAKNPARRSCTDFPKEVLQNRKLLEDYMVNAAKDLGHDLLPLASEWWDFRFQKDRVIKYAPISDKQLPPDMRMTTINQSKPSAPPPPGP
jgi:D-alanyl-D-alanine dipeptidase